MSAQSAGAATPHKIEAGSWVYDKDLECLVPKHGRNYFDRHELRSDLPSPAIRPDGMSANKSMADGHNYDVQIGEPNYGGGMFTKLLQSQAQRHYGFLQSSAGGSPRWGRDPACARVSRPHCAPRLSSFLS